MLGVENIHTDTGKASENMLKMSRKMPFGADSEGMAPEYLGFSSQKCTAFSLNPNPQIIQTTALPTHVVPDECLKYTEGDMIL